MTSKTRNRRAAQQIIEAEAEAAAQQLRRAGLEAALAERTAPGIAPYEPIVLARLLRDDPAAYWRTLAAMTSEQRLNQAIETACWLEGMDRGTHWSYLLRLWERGIAEESHKQAA